MSLRPLFFALAVALISSIAQAVPQGIYKFKSDLTNISYNLYIVESQSIFGSIAVVSEIPANHNEAVSYVTMWNGQWNEKQNVFIADGATQRDINSIEMRQLGTNEIEGGFVTTNETLSADITGQIAATIPFKGQRIDEEKELLDVVASNPRIEIRDHLTVEGTYQGIGPSGRTWRFHLRAVDRGAGGLRWMVGSTQVRFQCQWWVRWTHRALSAWCETQDLFQVRSPD